MQNENFEQLIPIGKAAEQLGVSIDTLRRWDRKGVFPAVRTPGKHRYYTMEQISRYQKDLFSLAREWAVDANERALPDETYCPTSITFQTRLMRMEKTLLQDPSALPWASLVVSATGEIGNNSFDHNLGNWRDVPGIFFGYDTNKKLIVLADRGQGVLATLKRVRPALETDEAALATAFTEIVSGRAPEARGNGLKLVRLITERYSLSVDFYSGNAKVTLRHGRHMVIGKSGIFVPGSLALLTYYLRPYAH